MTSDKPTDHQRRLDKIIFEADKPPGNALNPVLLHAIILSAGAAVLESVPSVRRRFGTALRIYGWLITTLLTGEYVPRPYRVERPPLVSAAPRKNSRP